MKYSKRFERDYEFYLSNIENFKFCGTLLPKHSSIYNLYGKSAKEVFYSIESIGKNIPTNEPSILDSLLLCKASVNFQIKQWAEGRVDGTLPLNDLIGENSNALEWKVEIIDGIRTPISIYSKSIKDQYNLPDWVIGAIENQRIKLIKKNNGRIF